MSDRNREPKGKRTDRRVLVVSAVLAAVVLALFLLVDLGGRPAPDTTAGGPDADYSAPREPEETAPATASD